MKTCKMGMLTFLVVTLLILSSGCKSNDSTRMASPDEKGSSQVESTISDKDEGSTQAVTEGEASEETKTEAAEADLPIEWVKFTNLDKNFELMIPSNWVIVDRDSYGILLRPNNETQTTFYVDTRTTEYADYTYDDFIDEMMGDLKRLMGDHTFSEAETLQINDYPFVVISHSGLGMDGINYKYKTYFTANTLGYKMNYVADDKEFDMYQPIMEEIAWSFKFIN